MIESAIRSAIRSVIMNKMLYVIEPALRRLLFFIPAKQRARQPCLHGYLTSFQLDAECKIARSGVEQQTVIKVLCIKDLSELFRRHQVIAL